MAILVDRGFMMLGDTGDFEASQFPGDLMLQIVSRLPVKSITRFKCVCKGWYALFSNPKFIQYHCRMTSSCTKLKNLLSLLIHTKNHKFNDPIFTLLLDRSSGERSSMNLNPPFECDLSKIKVVGSINGLVCLSLCKKATSLVLWNPATYKHSQIPSPQLSLTGEERVSVGFAYDENTDAYKIIRVLNPLNAMQLLHSEIRFTRVEIYNTQTNTWTARNEVDLPWLCDQITCGVVVSGVPYWYALDCPKQDLNFRELVMLFDPSEETFVSVPLPSSPSREICMSFMGDHPVAFSYMSMSRQDLKFTFVDIFKLNRYNDGDKDVNSVQKLSMELFPSLTSIVGFGRNGEIFGIDSNGDLLIYDRRCSEAKVVPYHAAWGWYPKVYDYTESLVSPPPVA